MNSCEIEVTDKLLEKGCSSQFVRKFLEAALFHEAALLLCSLISSNSKLGPT